METHSIDSKLMTAMNEQMGVTAPVEKTETPPEAPQVTAEPENETAPLKSESAPESQSEYIEQVSPDTDSGEIDSKSVDTKADSDSPIDEYGNPIEKPKTYTEDEVQRMIRERLSRGRHNEQPTKAEVSSAQQEFKADPNSEESWEAQLENFIDRHLEKHEKKRYETQWKAEAQKRQADFESKFTTGMNKYKDFHQVVSNIPITDNMMLATQSLENPAAFIYGACKMHPKEVEKIAHITDPYIQAAEIGRLHERMVKERKMVTSAAKPIEAPKGSVPQKGLPQLSIEDRITQYAKQKRR